MLAAINLFSQRARGVWQPVNKAWPSLKRPREVVVRKTRNAASLWSPWYYLVCRHWHAETLKRYSCGPYGSSQTTQVNERSAGEGWTSQEERNRWPGWVTSWSLHPRKGQFSPSSHCEHTKTRSQTISFPPLPSWEVFLLKSHPACSLAHKATHAATEELPRSHTFKKKSRHSTRSSSFDSVCPIIPHFFFPLPPAPSTLWKPLLRETKSVISLVVLMHQTFLISGIEKRAAQL